MTQSIVSGVYSEDFNYGYPYTNPARYYRNLPPQFSYNTEAITQKGRLSTSARFKRTDFTLCYLSKDIEPNNIDLGAHSGAHSAAPYYLMFPTLSWDEVVVMDLVITVTQETSLLTYDRSFDGVSGDRFILVINGQERRTTTRSAGHNWTTDLTNLRKGRNRIQWVVQTCKYNPPTARGGTSVSNPRVPTVKRYFRMCRLTVNNVAVFPGGTVGNFGAPVYADLGSSGTYDIGASSFNGRKGQRGIVKMTGYGTIGYKAKNAKADIVGTSTSSFTVRQNINAKAGFIGTGAFGITSNMVSAIYGFDAILEVTGEGALTVEVPFNTPQNINSLVVPLQQVTFTMSTPIFVNGKPYTPKYSDSQTFNATSTGAYTYNDPVSPSSISHVLPVTPTYRWITTDIGGADDANVTSWPEHVTPGSNPAWVSNSTYAPTIHPHEHFSDLGAEYVTYSRTLHFYAHGGEHMWMTMPATAFPTTVTSGTPFQPYTWMFVAMLHPVAGQDHYQGITLLDSYLNSATPADYSTNIANDDEVPVNDGTGSYRSLVRFREGKAIMSSNNATTLTQPWQMNYKPCVYFATFNGANSSLTAYGNNYMQRMVGNAGSGSNYLQGFLMSRTNGWFSRYNFSTFTIFEAAFFNRVVTPAEMKTLSNYLSGVYQFQKYR